MDLNTANNSARESVKTRPKLKAYFFFILELFKNNQHVFALIAGYILTALLFFSLGGFVARSRPPDVKIEEPPLDLSQLNNILKSAPPQSDPRAPGAGAVAGESSDLNCLGRIKGNIGSSGKIYHVPGGAFYDRTVPELCFDTEVAAQAAGFRKSQR
jgi:hypothetical protein